MSDASGLIERMERETGQRIDANDGDNLAMAGLFGAVARLMGKTPSNYAERDDVAAGILIRYQMTPEYAREQQAKAMLAGMLRSGLSPDDLKDILG